MKVDLSHYQPTLDRGASRWTEAAWLLTNLVVFRFLPFSASKWKSALLRAFGATIGSGVVIKPGVRITFPWKLVVGDHVWLGEDCWLLNLAPIHLASHVCISQRAFLCTGNHDHRSPTFGLITRPIHIDEGAWIGAGAWVGPGVHVGTLAFLTAGSVAPFDLEPSGIYQGNPARFVRPRVIG